MDSSFLNIKMPYQWEELNEQVRKTLAISENVRVFQTMEQALVEISMGMHLLYSHKMEFSHSFGMGVHSDPALLLLARQGLKAKELDRSDLPEIDAKTSLISICDLDDALTGETYFDDGGEAINEKSFRIWLSHHKHKFQEPVMTLKPTDIVIYNFQPQFVVACLGKRLQNLRPLEAPTLKWSYPKGFQGWETSIENKEWVVDVESNRWGGGIPLLAENSRIYDRALLYWPDIEASALRDMLLAAGIDGFDVECFSFGRWSDTKILDQFKKRGWSDEMFRGTLVMSSKLSENKQFLAILKQAYEALKAKSQF